MREELKKIFEESKLSLQEVAKRMGGSFNEKAVKELIYGDRNLGISAIQQLAFACGYEFKGIFEKMKIHDLDNICIRADINDFIKNIAIQKAAKAIIEKYPKIDLKEFPTEQFREFPDGSGEVFLVFRDLRFTMPVPKGCWHYNN